MTEPVNTDAVTVAYVHNGSDVAYSWHTSLLRLLMHDSHHHKRVIHGGFATIKGSSDGITQARNRVVRDFLEGSQTPWLWWIDTDMGFAPDTIDRLIEAADPVERPVVGGLCFAQRDDLGSDGMGGYRPSVWPVLMDWSDKPGNVGFLPRLDYPLDTVTPAVGTGSACILIHRSVFERMREKQDDPTWSRWYSKLPTPSGNGEDLAEDLSFCLRMRELGIPLHVHTGVKTTHMKPTWLAEDGYLDSRTRVNEQLAAAKAQGRPVPHINVPASLTTLANNEHVRPDGLLKLDADLTRYKAIIEATRPEVIVETGTHKGASARWFAQQSGVERVITVDIDERERPDDGIIYAVGDSADPAIAAAVTSLVAGRRCMVVLDSDHSGPHVAKEIKLYGPLVSPGCYLVVEDGIFGLASQALRDRHLPGLAGSPLDAIAEHLHGKPGWSRDIAIERMSATSHHPCGYWVRTGDIG